MHKLAIIIPAYKATFLPATLDSIAAQTCQDFTLYVGDDYSPEPIGSIVEQYRDNVDLVYKRLAILTLLCFSQYLSRKAGNKSVMCIVVVGVSIPVVWTNYYHLFKDRLTKCSSDFV